MTTTALDVVTRALRLINVPGRGGFLSKDDTAAALEALQDLINSESVSKYFVPGVRRHFFDLQPNTDVYTYGPGGQMDTNDFRDPLPVRIEEGYIREGAVRTDIEQVTNGTFTTATDWTLGAGWSIANGKLTIATGNTTLASQALALTAGTTYVVRLSVTQRASSIQLRILQDAVPILTQTLATQASYEYEFTITGGATWAIDFTANVTSDIDIDDVSVLQKGKDRFQLSIGSDYSLRLIDQHDYNSRFSKGTDGRPYELYFNRNFPLGEIRFDNSAIAGDILVLDVLTNRVAVDQLADTLQLHPDAIKWLKYRLAMEIAPEYGKSVSRQHERVMREAYTAMAAGNERQNHLRSDPALVSSPSFEINRGDP